jgi:hypothetical protein
MGGILRDYNQVPESTRLQTMLEDRAGMKEGFAQRVWGNAVGPRFAKSSGLLLPVVGALLQNSFKSDRDRLDEKIANEEMIDEVRQRGLTRARQTEDYDHVRTTRERQGEDFAHQRQTRQWGVEDRAAELAARAQNTGLQQFKLGNALADDTGQRFGTGPEAVQVAQDRAARLNLPPGSVPVIQRGPGDGYDGPARPELAVPQTPPPNSFATIGEVQQFLAESGLAETHDPVARGKWFSFARKPQPPGNGTNDLISQLLNPPAASNAGGQKNQLRQEAEAAIAAGKDPRAVRARYEQMTGQPW